MPSKLIFIASLGHSGSTVTDLALGAHPGIVGLGEVSLAVKSFGGRQRVCTCGKESPECPVWGQIATRLGSSGHTLHDAYRAVGEVVDDVFGSDAIVVDSSKYLESLRVAVDVYGAECHVLFLVRDVRGYVASRQRRPELSGLRKFPSRSTAYSGLIWLRRNQAIKSYIDSHVDNSLQIGYEELAFRPEEMFRKICDFIGVQFDERMLIPDNSNSHIIRGNEMRYDAAARSAITYDHRWLSKATSPISQLMLAPVMRWNAENVYSNL